MSPSESRPDAEPPSSTAPPDLERLLARTVSGYGDRPALVVPGGVTLTWRELEGRVAALAGHLSACGVRRGDRIVSQLDRSVDAIAALYAATRLGGVLAPVHPRWKPRQLNDVMADLDARMLLVDGRRKERLSRALELDPAAICVTDDPPRGRPLPSQPVAPDTLTLVLYTSGSTGPPKGVPYTQRRLAEFARVTATTVGNRYDDRVLHVVNPAASYGLAQHMSALFSGAALVLQTSPLIADIAKTIDAEEITGVPGVPGFLRGLADYLGDAGRRCLTPRYITCGAGALPVPVLRRLATVMPRAEVKLLYGSTEASRVACLLARPEQMVAGALGPPLPEVETWVLGADDAEVGADVPGELVVRGPSTATSYWRRPELSAQRFRPPPGGGRGAPAFWTGDRVRRDRAGALHYMGRVDGMLRIGDTRLSPEEVESVLLEAGLVRQAVAFAIGVGTEPVLHLAAAGWADGADEAAVRRLCRRQLPGYAVPTVIHRWQGAMPVTGSGKVDRRAVAAAYQQQQTQGATS